MKIAITEAVAAVLRDEALSDRERAAAIGCSLRSVPTLRLRLGLEARPNGRPSVATGGRINGPETRRRIVQTWRENQALRA